MIGKTLTLMLAASLLALANPVDASELAPEDDDALACLINIGTCTYGPCGVNVGYCGGNCDVNVGYCDGPDCGINVGSCGGNTYCFINTAYCPGNCGINLGICGGPDCVINLGTCGNGDSCNFDGESRLQLFCLSSTTSAADISCDVNVGQCQSGPCGVNVGYCGGNCDVNVGTCDGPDCGINVGTCGTGGYNLCELLHQQKFLPYYRECPDSTLG